MKIIAYINWIFFLFVALYFAAPFIEGMDKSFTNVYETRGSTFVKTDEESSLLLYAFPNIDAYAGLKVEQFPFHLFSHFVIKQMDDTGKHKSPWLSDTLNYYSILENHGYLAEKLAEKNLLISLKSNQFGDKLLEKSFDVLDTLKSNFPESNCGLIFEFDVKGKNIVDSQRIINKHLKDLKAKTKNLTKRLSSEQQLKYYVCLNFLHQGTSINNFFLDTTFLQSFNKKIDFEGLLLKTFDEKYSSIKGFDRLEEVVENIDNANLNKEVFICVPSYPVITKHPKEDHANIEKWNTNHITLLDSTNNIKDSTFYSYLIQKKDTIIFESKESLINKLDTIKSKKLNLGFWGFIEPIYTANQPDENQSTDNPMTDLFKFAKGNVFKKILKKPKKVLEQLLNYYPENEDSNINWANQSEWYWQTVEKEQLSNTPKPPDYLLFLFAPLFSFRIILPIYMLFIFGLVYRNVGNNFFERIELFDENKWFGIPSAYLLLIGDLLLWGLILGLFVFYNNQFTTRALAILLLLAIALGRPAIKFIIKFIKLGAKPMGIGLFRKLGKMLEPLLEMVYHRFQDDEKEKILKFIADNDRDKDFYNQTERKKIGVKEAKLNEEQLQENLLIAQHWERANQFFNFKESPRLNEFSEQENTKEKMEFDNKGSTVLEDYKKITFVAKCFFIALTFILLFFHYYPNWWAPFLNMELLSKGNYLITGLIFLLEIFILFKYFKEYYVYRLFKMF